MVIYHGNGKMTKTIMTCSKLVIILKQLFPWPYLLWGRLADLESGCAGECLAADVWEQLCRYTLDNQGQGWHK